MALSEMIPVRYQSLARPSSPFYAPATKRYLQQLHLTKVYSQPDWYEFAFTNGVAHASQQVRR